MQNTPNKWFSTWFDTPYYHILYQNRSHNEAEIFIKNLHNYLKLPQNSHVLDLACGKGRHSITLNQLGYTVLGTDLSPQSIQAAQLHQNPTLRFQVQDMRVPLPQKFDAVFNLFTSFGYFDDPADDQKVLQSIAKMLKHQGTFVIDYLNPTKAIADLNPHEILEKNGISFEITRELKNNFIQKQIKFEADSQPHQYTEQVRAYTNADLKALIAAQGFEIKAVFGSYNLDAFDPKNSVRQIIIAQKNQHETV